MKKRVIKIAGSLLIGCLLSSFLIACDSSKSGRNPFLDNHKHYNWGDEDYYDIDDDYGYWEDDDDRSSNPGGGKSSSSNNGGSASQTGDTVDKDNPYFDFSWNSSDHTASICFKSGMENPNPVVPITYVYNGENYRIIDDDKAPGFSYMMIVETITIQEGFEKIQNGFCHDMNLISVKLPSTLKKIHASPFVNCSKLQKVEYNGTMAQWEAIQKNDDYNYGLPQDITIVCKDGNLTLPKDPDW